MDEKYYFIYYEIVSDNGSDNGNGYTALKGFGSPQDFLKEFLESMVKKGFNKETIIIKQFNPL